MALPSDPDAEIDRAQTVGKALEKILAKEQQVREAIAKLGPNEEYPTECQMEVLIDHVTNHTVASADIWTTLQRPVTLGPVTSVIKVNTKSPIVPRNVSVVLRFFLFSFWACGVCFRILTTCWKPSVSTIGACFLLWGDCLPLLELDFTGDLLAF
ncbi:hypothetical protein ACI3L0_002627 [Candidozyma auris]